MTIDGIEGLLSLVQGNVLEIHPWGSSLSDLERPDRLIFDLDPGEEVHWSAVIEAALEVRARLLSGFKLQSFVKTTGGKGLHVVVPVIPSMEWERAKALCEGVARAMAADSPDRYVAHMAKGARKGKVFVDYLRNGRGATAVAAYSTRARPGAAVSTPLQLGRAHGSHQIGSLPARQHWPSACQSTPRSVGGVLRNASGRGPRRASSKARKSRGQSRQAQRNGPAAGERKRYARSASCLISKRHKCAKRLASGALDAD